MNINDILISLLLGVNIFIMLFYSKFFIKTFIINGLILLTLLIVSFDVKNEAYEALLALFCINILNFCAYFIRVKTKKL